MRLIIIAALALGLSGCASGLPGTKGSNFDLNAFLNSTTCAHHDSVSGATTAGGVPAFVKFDASRDCPAVPPAPVVAPVAP